MNREQGVRHVANLLRGMVWVPTPGARTLSAVIETSQPAELFYREIPTPYCTVRPAAVQVDPNHPQRVKLARYEVELMLDAFGDGEGRSVLIGANRITTGQSEGRGLLDLEVRILRELSGLDGRGGMMSVATPAQVGTPVALPGSVMAAKTVFTIEHLNATRDPFYGDALWLKVLPASGGFTASWVAAPGRFDLLGSVACYAPGSGARPTKPSDGTAITLSGYSATSLSKSGLSASSWWVAIFQAYDPWADPPDTAPATERAYSLGLAQLVTST